MLNEEDVQWVAEVTGDALVEVVVGCFCEGERSDVTGSAQLAHQQQQVCSSSAAAASPTHPS